ncbi:hypothetical protein SAMN04244553_2682 [Nocardia amikacinitolerans]|uniref:Uncharacterized protein n=1 Tax=Nocardia amikacinitolerans TaxID=756689 RepID=A0A285L9F4_9NOCA|nr:hypothetical protein [Nocardia amikacinitolerans]SNY81103.1 hypothetical protein SAMN04244553_2682 [Nocardia amikacinitolerans]
MSFNAASVAAAATSPANPVNVSFPASFNPSESGLPPRPGPPDPPNNPSVAPATPAVNNVLPDSTHSSFDNGSRRSAATCANFNPTSRKASSNTASHAPRNAARPAAFAAAFEMIRFTNCLIATRIATCVAARAAAPAAAPAGAPTPVAIAANAAAISTAKITNDAMITNLVCSISAAPSPI